MFPLTLGQIIREYSVAEMHLTLNAGNWDYERWGPPEEPSVGTGAELWAWIQNSGAQERFVPWQKRRKFVLLTSFRTEGIWRGLRNSLAGLVCVSLGTLDEQRTTSATMAFPPGGSLDESHHTLRHMALPSEHVCTENLTPFLKLLPCKSSSGISSLLNPHRLLDADWHGMGLHVWKNGEGLLLRLTLQAVSDPLRVSYSQMRQFPL